MDFHNTSGRSPAYGVTTRLGESQKALTALVSDHLIVTDLRLGTLMEATEDDSPTITAECGGAGDARSDQTAMTALRSYAMAEPSEHHATEAKRNPLIPVGLTVLAVLVIPLCIYSFGPEGPIKKSHVVFSTGQHRAHFADETLYDEYRGYCFLQARDQLLVVESAEARSDGAYLAQTLGTRKRKFPDCPSQSYVILYEHQITLRPDLWGGLQDALGQLFSSG